MYFPLLPGNNTSWSVYDLRCVFTKLGLEISWCQGLEKDIHFKRDFGRNLKRMYVRISFGIMISVVLECRVKMKSYPEMDLRKTVWMTPWIQSRKERKENMVACFFGEVKQNSQLLKHSMSVFDKKNCYIICLCELMKFDDNFFSILYLLWMLIILSVFNTKIDQYFVLISFELF